MRRPIFELILQYVDQLIKSVSAIGFYDNVIVDVERQMVEAQPIYDNFKTKADDQKHFSSLSPPEQQALGQNEINYKHLLRTMNETISTLMGQKWTNNIKAALWCLDDLTLTLEDVLSETLNDAGKEIKAKELVPSKRFADADYLGRISVVQTAINVLRDEVTADANYGDDSIPDVKLFAWSINNSLGKTFLLLQRELEDIETNGLPKLHDFGKPPVVEPEIPKAPSEEIPEVEQQELPLDPDSPAEVEPEKAEA